MSSIPPTPSFPSTNCPPSPFPTTPSTYTSNITSTPIVSSSTCPSSPTQPPSSPSAFSIASSSIAEGRIDKRKSTRKEEEKDGRKKGNTSGVVYHGLLTVQERAVILSAVETNPDLVNDKKGRKKLAEELGVGATMVTKYIYKISGLNQRPPPNTELISIADSIDPPACSTTLRNPPISDPTGHNPSSRNSLIVSETETKQTQDQLERTKFTYQGPLSLLQQAAITLAFFRIEGLAGRDHPYQAQTAISLGVSLESLRAYLTEIKDSQAALPRKVQADDIWLQKRDLDRFLGLESWDFGSEGEQVHDDGLSHVEMATDTTTAMAAATPGSNLQSRSPSTFKPIGPSRYNVAHDGRHLDGLLATIQMEMYGHNDEWVRNRKF